MVLKVQTIYEVKDKHNSKQKDIICSKEKRTVRTTSINRRLLINVIKGKVSVNVSENNNSKNPVEVNEDTKNNRRNLTGVLVVVDGSNYLLLCL